MIKLGKEKGCEKISHWVKGVRNHLYWCAMSTRQGFEDLIDAKWRSLMQHVANKHDNHGSPLFQKCAHDDEIESRRWIRIGIKLLIFTLSAVFQIILPSINVVD